MRLATTRLYDYLWKHNDLNTARAVTGLTIQIAATSGSGVCRLPIQNLFNLLTSRKYNTQPFYEDLAQVMAANRLRLGED